MESILRLTGGNQGPAEDPHHAAAVERGRAAVKELQERGIIDAWATGSRQTCQETCWKAVIETAAANPSDCF